jgi:hypothetical protein
MFFRRKRVDSRDYLQIVRQPAGRRSPSSVSVVATLGRVADLEQDGTLARLPRSGARVCDETVLLSAPEREQADVIEARRIGAPPVEWSEVVFDLKRLALVETTIEQDNKRLLVSTAAPGCSEAVFKAVGVALPPMVRSGQPPPAELPAPRNPAGAASNPENVVPTPNARPLTL